MMPRYVEFGKEYNQGDNLVQICAIGDR